MGHQSCCLKQKLRKGLWSPEEDEKLYNHITQYGVGSWSSVPKLAGLQRCGKSCRLRWINYLRPDLKRGMFSQEEEDLILSLHESLGNRWAQIATRLPGRTDNEIKNYWNSCLKKKLMSKGIDPNTHKPMQTKDDEHKHESSNSAGMTTQQQQQQQQMCHSESTIFADGAGDRLVSARDSFVGSKQTYDCFFLSELQDHCLRPYPQIGGDPINPINPINPSCGLDSISSLKSFVHENEETAADYSDISAGYVMNEVKESSSNSSTAASLVNNSQCGFPWEPKNIQLVYGGIQKKASLWEEGNQQQLMNLSQGDFGNFPLASLSQELPEADNLQDFHHCNNL